MMATPTTFTSQPPSRRTTSRLTPQPFFISSSSSSSIHFRRPKLLLSLSHSSSVLLPFTSSPSLLWPITTNKNRRRITVLALVEEEDPLAATVTAPPPEEEEEEEEAEETTPRWEGDNADVSGSDLDSVSKNLTRPCELYVCNLPSSCGITELHDLFKPYGTVHSVEVSRNAETGISKGCGYVTMSSMEEARAAFYALDGSDVGGREMRIRFSADMNTKRKNLDALNSAPKKNLIFESPYKVYVGNLAWSVKPEDLRNLFCQFGTVVSARVLHDRKAGKNRVYGFLSFSSADEAKSALSLNGTDFCDRTLILREVVTKTES